MLLIVLAVTLLGLTTLVLVSAEKRGRGNAAVDQNQKRRIEPVFVTLKPTGFEPAELTRRRGAFLLMVDNRSNNPELLFHLDGEHGKREHEQQTRRGGRLDWNKVVDLPPGRYLLTEANHPQWVCKITIEN
jgi:hypothetical protein